MMKNMFALSSACLLAFTSVAMCNQQVDSQQPVHAEKKVADQAAAIASAEKKADKAQEVDIAKVSEAFGHLLSKNIQTTGVNFDIASVIKGLQDAASGKDSPMTEIECIQAITSAQENLFKEKSEQNLKKAQEFLTTNAKEKNVISLESGKVQYKVEKEGAGAVVESHFSPLIHYTGKFLDGTVFGSSKEDEMLSLDEIIPGLKAGLVGMKEGEKRTIYIHPEMGYGTHGYLPPNSLLTFEIEVIKANSPKPEQNESATALEPQTTSQEIGEAKASTR